MDQRPEKEEPEGQIDQAVGGEPHTQDLRVLEDFGQRHGWVEVPPEPGPEVDDLLDEVDDLDHDPDHDDLKDKIQQQLTDNPEMAWDAVIRDMAVAEYDEVGQ